MKSFLLLTLLLFFTSNINSQNFDWTWQNPLPTGADYNDAVVLSSTDFMLFGNGGAVLKSTDAGMSWMAAYVDTGKRDIYTATFIGQSVGYLAGTGGLVMKTTDAGSTWFYLQSGVTTTLWDADFINADTGFVVGASGTILKTTDGGLNFTPANYGTTTLYKIHFLNNNIGYMGSASTTTGRLIKTTDGGTSWQDVTAAVPGLTGTVRGIHFVNDTLGFISNSAGRIFKTTNGGSTWAESYYIGSTTATIYEVKFADENYGYAISSAGRVLQTTDSGVNWTLTQTTATKNLFGLGLLNVESEQLLDPVLVGGDAGTILMSSDGTNWSAGFYAVSQEQLQRASFPTPTVGYVVGGSITTGNEFGDILKTTDGGATWNKLAYQPAYRCYSVFFLDENNGFVGSEGPEIYKTTDGGLNWTTIPIGVGTASNINYDIDFFDQNLGFVCNSSGLIARTTDGGATWSSVSAGWTAAAIYDMHIIDSLNIYIVGPGGRVSKSINAGASFNQLASLGTATLYSIFFTEPTTGFISASGGRIYKTTDGFNFSEITNPLSGTIYVVRFVSTQKGWVAGSLGEVFYTEDGGSTWTEANISLSSTVTIRDIQINGNDLWMVGTEGYIIKGFSDPSIPVELTSFTAFVNDKQVQLKWITATELNNSGFSVERKIEGNDWKKIGFVSGNGTTTENHFYSYTDDLTSVFTNNGKILYRLKQIDFDGSFEYSNTLEVVLLTPDKFTLEQNYPNPFNPSTIITFHLAKASNVELKVYDIIGNEIATLVNEYRPAGVYKVPFSIDNNDGLSSGIYFYKITAGDFVQTRKMILIK